MLYVVCYKTHLAQLAKNPAENPTHVARGVGPRQILNLGICSTQAARTPRDVD